MKSYSQRTSEIAPSMTVSIDTLAKQLAREGKDILSLGAGEPDFLTPKKIREAGIKAIREGKTRYTPPTGILEVREAICQKLFLENHLEYTPEQIVLTSGAKQAVFNALAALIDPGDEVLIFSPYWVTYPELVRWFGGVPIFVEPKSRSNFKVTAEEIQEKLSPKTKALILNNPCNPSGEVFTREELESIAKIACDADLFCIADEIYEHFVYGVPFYSLASFPNLFERTILINGFSKSHCMTGWRIGYNAAPKEISSLIGKIQSQAIHHPSAPAQYGALAAIDCRDSVLKMRETFQSRRDFFCQKIAGILKREITLPDGAFYLFTSVEHLFGKKTPSGKTIENSIDFCTFLLESVGLAIIPGKAFGMDSCVRFSYAASLETLLEACERFERGVNLLK